MNIPQMETFVENVPGNVGEINGSRLNSDSVRLQNGCVWIGMRSRPGQNHLGQRKQNQDRPLIKNVKLGTKEALILGVLDGHGKNGKEACTFVRDRFVQKILDLTTTRNSIGSAEGKQALAETWNDLNAQKDFSIEKSGCAVNICIIQEDLLSCFNVGDCRAVLGRYENYRWLTMELSTDHSPDNPEERERIESHGGKVGKVGLLRIFFQDSWEQPGLSMTRSFGDSMAQQIGLIGEADVTEHTLIDIDRILIIASDGIWEHTSSEEAISFASRFLQKSPQEAAEQLVEKAKTNWEEKERTVDDCTCIVAFLSFGSAS